MSGETMYSLKPIITKDFITKINDNCMYEMKNIHEICSSDDHAPKLSNNVTDVSEQVINFLKTPLPEVAVLGERQEKILAQLDGLMDQFLSLCNILKPNNAGLTAGNSLQKYDPVVVDVIINANPEKPCWIVPALQKIWKDVNFSVKCYRHSTMMVNPPPEFSVDCKSQFHDTVNVTLIWKKVENTEIVAPGVHAYPLIGESNFLRYLSRKLPSKNYESLSSAAEISRTETILDMSHRLHYQESAKDIQSTLTDIGALLGEKNWFSNEENPTMLDAAAWSAIKRAALKKIPSKLNSWCQRCENTFLK